MAKNLPPDTTPGLEGNTFFEPSNFTYPFGAHIAVVEVDADTGGVDIQRYVCVDDIGNIINPYSLRAGAWRYCTKAWGRHCTKAQSTMIAVSF